MDKMQALRDALDALREASLTDAPETRAKPHTKAGLDTVNALERVSAAPTLDWTREALLDLEPSALGSYRIAFDVLIGARRGYLSTLGDDVVFELGREALKRFSKTGSVVLSDYSDIGAQYEARFYVPDFEPSGDFTYKTIKEHMTKLYCIHCGHSDLAHQTVDGGCIASGCKCKSSNRKNFRPRVKRARPLRVDPIAALEAA